MLGGLSINIDFEGMQALAAELGATELQVKKAAGRALARTAATIRKRASKELRVALGLRNVKALRRRLKGTSLRRGGSRAELGVWFGANDLPISAFKGRPTASPVGAQFRGVSFSGGFIAKKTHGTDVGKRTIFQRKTAADLPIAEQKLPVSDQMLAYVEDEVFPDIGAIFMTHFRADLRARATLGI
jgi:hypothetical protein